MRSGWSRIAIAIVAVVPLFVFGCGKDDEPNRSDPAAGGAGPAGGAGGASFYPVVDAADPCLTAGLSFDGESDCDVVRCPEFVCECPSREPVDPGDPPLPPVELVLGGCAPEAGCLERVDCARACDTNLELTLAVCEARVAYVQVEHCNEATDCVVGECRDESIGSVCVDTVPCSEDGHCGAGFKCLFDPDWLDSETDLPTAPGSCADGEEGSLCYENDDCAYGTCSGERCTGGDDGDACEFNRNCASGRCRIDDAAGATGICVDGAVGSSCLEDDDCVDGAYCVSGTCATGEEGQPCETDEHCESGICVSARCSEGGLGAWCEDDADCTDAHCVGMRCVSGEALAPCVEADDCEGGLRCVRSLCVDGSVGSPCSSADDCTVLACVGGICRDGSEGSVCEADADCEGGHCANPAGVEPGECTSGESGAFCIYASHCESGVCDAGACE
jgi:hypothetical protein